MARHRLAVAAVLAMAVWLGSARAAFGCTGLDATLVAGLRHATTVYYARITDAIAGDAGFYTLTLHVDRQVRGEALPVVSQAVSAKVCSGLEPGQFGLVVLGARNAFEGDGSAATYNLFYVLGPGYYSRAAADALVLGLPATDTGSPVVSDPEPAGATLLRDVGLMALFSATLLLVRRRAWSLTDRLLDPSRHSESQ
jgi:hypothetical protein